jgi:hypothetical protein
MQFTQSIHGLGYKKFRITSLSSNSNPFIEVDIFEVMQIGGHAIANLEKYTVKWKIVSSDRDIISAGLIHSYHVQGVPYGKSRDPRITVCVLEKKEV